MPLLYEIVKHKVGSKVSHVPQYTSSMVVKKKPGGYDIEAVEIAPMPNVSIESIRMGPNLPS
jgi:hypothetical protein